MASIQNESRALASLFAIVLLAPPVYVNNIFVIPFFKKSISTFILLFLINIIVFTSTSIIILNKVSELEFEWNRYFNLLGIMVLALVFASALKVARDSFSRRQQEKEAELKLLKAQLNPHFLFNTLNNLYGLSVVKSDKLPSLMLKLSDLLRYSLYETKDILVPLDKEITYLKNYIALEKIRLEDTTEINFERKGSFSDYVIAPMLLIVFVENAFKHLTAQKKQKSNVTITIKTESDLLAFYCSNSIDSALNKENNLEKGKSGIGLVNVKKRLALIYPNKHQLKVQKTEEKYVVDLKLNIK